MEPRASLDETPRRLAVARKASRLVPRQIRLPAVLLMTFLWIVFMPAGGIAASTVVYLTGDGAVGAVVDSHDPQFANRNFNQVWHQPTFYHWTVWYQDTGSHVSCSVSNANNPTKCSTASSNKRALAQNLDDDSATVWTAQTTEP